MMDAERRVEMLNACDAKLETSYAGILDVYRCLKYMYGPTNRGVRQLDAVMTTTQATRKRIQRYKGEVKSDANVT